MSIPKEQQSGASDLVVTIVACGPCITNAGGGGTASLVYAITVMQPVQCWTIVRSHTDFQMLHEAVSSHGTGVEAFPALTGQVDFSTMIRARNELQSWLSAILLHPSACAIPEVSQFLTLGANTVPPQYVDVSWTLLQPQTAVDAVPSNPNPQDMSGVSQQHHHYQFHSSSNSVNLDDMEMADMFLLTDDEQNVGGAPDDPPDYEEIPPASVRYKPVDETVTDEDEMELMQFADEVEMIEDIGSLAQSLGASHLGRSLQLQAELKHFSNKPSTTTVTAAPPLSVLNNRAAATTHGGLSEPQRAVGGGGGIGSVMENAATNAAHFNHRPLSSAPRLDSFKMIKVIGKGSFGKVFLVKEIKTGEVYALKVLRKDNIIKRNQVEHTNTERSVLGYVRHPFIVGMNMAFQSKDKLYFVLDYCAGGELFFQLGKLGKFNEARARFYAAEIILAISYVHSLDIVYRDLKPENVLLDAKGHIRLTDFGLSKEGISNSSSGANSFCGTPEYLAPEILNRQGHGRAVDWWSLGALLYEMITGLPPFYCQDREKLFEYIRKSTLEYPASVSRPAKKVLVGLLTKNPVHRLGSGPTDAEEIKEKEFFGEIDFDRLMKGEIEPPWTPPIKGNLDTSQFDKEFTTLPVFSPQSMQRSHGFGATPDSKLFEGFTFTDRGLHGPGARAGR